MYRIETRKDKIKIIRAILEGIVLILAVVAIVKALTTNTVYTAYDPEDTTVVSGKDAGFIAVSYFGVDRQGTDTLISTSQLDEQLKTLHDLGYVTISQEDVINYYEKGTALPDKALFLLFEDGRRDTALFARKILEKYNYKATILSYADKFEEKDPKFLSTKDLKELVDSGFWELGTNGYRLSYINSYDRYNRFLGQMTSDEFVRVNQYLGRNYNHYLMDYIRDEDGTPVESKDAMESRITQDYRYMEQIYSSEFGYVPKVYCIMHSNTGRFGNTESVSEANAENIEDLFSLNFNRDGFAFNTKDSSMYDLTRIQPQAYWSTNHLLMRIWDDLPDEQKENIEFVTGEGKRAEKAAKAWTLESGAAEFKKDNIILTSLPEGEGVLNLKDSETEDAEISAELQGNKIGSQTIYLRADEKHQTYISVALQNNHLVVAEKNDGSVDTLFEKDLHDLVDVKDRISVEEDKRDSLAAEFNMRGRFADSAADSLVFYQAAKDAEKQKTKSVAEGAEEYVPDIQINELGDTEIKIILKGQELHVLINGEDITGAVEVSVQGKGLISLGASWGGWGYSQRNVADDVYDGVFKNLVIKENDQTVFDNSLHGGEKLLDTAGAEFNKILNWFIENL